MDWILATAVAVLGVFVVVLLCLLKEVHSERDDLLVVHEMDRKEIGKLEADVKRLREKHLSAMLKWQRQIRQRSVEPVAAETCGQPACVKDGCQKPEACEKEKTASEPTREQLVSGNFESVNHGTFCRVMGANPSTDAFSPFLVTSVFASTEPPSPPTPSDPTPSVSVDSGSAASDYGCGNVDAGSSGAGGGDW